jgi:hypothetical protein
MPKVTIELGQREMTALRQIAQREVRTVEQQATYFVRKGIEAYWRPQYRGHEQNGDYDESITEEA